MMRQKRGTRAGKAEPLSRLVSASSPSYASTSVEHDAGNTAMLKGYILGQGAIETVSHLGLGMRGGRRGRMISVTGPYGSGKSAMGVFIDCLAYRDKSPQWNAAFDTLRRTDPSLAAAFRRGRAMLKVKKSGMIRCSITARREPITSTVLRAMDAGARRHFRPYRASSFAGAAKLKSMVRMLDEGKVPSAKSVTDVVAGLCKVAPVLFIIDEFGKNIEYFTDSGSGEGDLFLLQEMAEMSGPDRKLPLFMITLQHMAFEEYAVGASTLQRQEWAKVQGRFDDVPVANSPEQTRLLISGALKLGGGARFKAAVEKWARREARASSAMGLGGDLNHSMLLSCYPLHPLVVEVLPEMCGRYGQYERTLLSFMAGGGAHTVSRFIDEGSWDGAGDLPTVRLDTLYDYFVSGSPLTHSISSNISRLMEIETIIRDSHGLTGEQTRALKTIGVLNLVGRSGRLRASKSTVLYATGAKSDSVLRSLEERSLVTYRRHADEYRIWHGTDVDIQAKMEIARRRLAAAPLAEMLESVMRLDPAVAARHAIKTGTVRILERRFVEPADAKNLEPKAEYDGLVAYVTGKAPEIAKRGACAKPLITVEPTGLEDLREAAIEASSVRDVLDRHPEISEDWVARRELHERLANAESSTERAFESTFGSGALWTDTGRGGKAGGKDTVPGAFISEACGRAYPHTPRLFNEMINRNALTAQGSTALRLLMGAMMENTEKPSLGIEGWGPERAMYEAVLERTGIHDMDSAMVGIMRKPHKEDNTRELWDRIIAMAKGSRRRVSVEDVYKMAREPPFGAKAGYMPVIITAILLANRDSMALYEHGTYCRDLTPEMGERMVKNPGSFEVKHFANSRPHREALGIIASALGVKPRKGFEVSLLDIVGHLVAAYSQLTPYAKKTKKIGKSTIAVREAIAGATEPDVLLLEAIPEALGRPKFGKRGLTAAGAKPLSRNLAKSMGDLRSTFDDMLDAMQRDLLYHAGIQDRASLSRAARNMIPHVQEKDMEVFLNAVSTDTFEDNAYWIKYVAMTVTGIPPEDWSDDQRKLFTNRMTDLSKRFRRLVSMYFAVASRSFQKPSYGITITHADGREETSIVSMGAKKKARIRDVAKGLLDDARKKGISDEDMLHLATEMLLESR